MSINLAQVKAKRLIWSFVNNSMRKAETQTWGSLGTTHAYIIKSSILIALIYIYHCNQGRPLIISKWATCRVNIWFLRTDNEPRIYKYKSHVCIFVEVIEDWNKPTSLSHHLLVLLILCKLDQMNPKRNVYQAPLHLLKKYRCYFKLICYVHADRKKIHSTLESW